ncbi:MAG: SCO family protein [Chloroflexi bacterium]|nr:SCO family protein [Chloroflexota bacterium]
MQNKTLSLRITTLALIIMILMASCGAPALKGEVISPTTAAADIILTDHNGQPFQLNAYSGKVALVFFGFSNCVDECPATLALIRQALETAGATSKDVVVVMVSTDPVRDTPQSMKEFMENFNPDFLGLLGTSDELTKVWQDYGVTIMDGGETHSSYTYVIDKKGNLREIFSPEATSDDIASDITVLLAEK